ncbi:MAG: glucuronyl hydrolase [Cyclobacteriaceae bacterium]
MIRIRFNFLISFLALSSLFLACTEKSEKSNDQPLSHEELAGFASEQFKVAIEALDNIHATRFPDESNSVVVPRSLRDDTIFYVRSRDWTSGFFGGNLWYMYELSGDEYWRDQAIKYSNVVEKEKFNKGTHDLGFMIYCSFGNGLRLTENASYKDIIIEASNSLISRFNPTVGCIRSWDHNGDKWMFPVIVDNMMNLEMLFWAAKATGDSTYYNIAVSHADTTLKYHFRADNSSYHVIDYDTISGEVLNKHTHQGYAHESAWARGQAWGLYGYSMCFRETGKQEYLDQAEKIAAFMLDHANLHEDLVPYWDYNAPEIPNAPRDVSAATIMASALFELSTFGTEKSTYYKNTAQTILDNVSAKYRSAPGANMGFLLDHSTGHLPGKHEIDVPIVYADYYYLEALLRSVK